MSNELQLNSLGQTPLPNNNGLSHLPIRATYMEVPPSVRRDDRESGLGEYWQMLQRRKWTLALIAFLGLLASCLMTLPQSPIYQARTTIEIRNLNENFLNMRDLSPTANEGSSDPLETDLQTQISILQSESLLKRVIAKLDLTSRLPQERKKTRLVVWLKKLHLPERQPIMAVEDVLLVLSKNLRIRTQNNTRIVEILYDSTDPVLAAEIANTLTVEFTRQNLESHWKTTEQTNEWLTRQLEDVRIKLEKSEVQLQDYAATAGLLFTSEKDNVAESKLRQLQEELSKAQADRVTWQSKYERVATASPDSLPEVLDDATLKDYQLKLADLRRQLAELSSILTPLHPSVKKVQAQVAALEAERDKERANVTGRLRNEFISAERRERLLAGGYDAQARLVTEQAAKSTHYDTLKREVINNRQIYDSMLQHVKEAGIASALHASNVRVIDPASWPKRPYKPNLVLNSLLGLFTGAFCGIVFIVLRERADRTIQAPGEASMYLDLPEFGAIPSAAAASSQSFAYYRQTTNALTRKLENENRIGPVELTTWRKQPSALADSFRSTLTSILYTGVNGDRPRVIALTSANAQDGKTTVASNLALAVAELGRRVLLIDGDLRRPRLHQIFNVSNVWGLSDLLDGRNPPLGSEAMVIKTSYGELYLLPAGTATSSISNLLHSPRAPEFLQRVRKDFDMVLIDTPPMLQMADARILGRLVDGVILVVRSGRTTKEGAAAAGLRLADDGTRVLGTILNDWDPRKAAHVRYEYGRASS